MSNYEIRCTVSNKIVAVKASYDACLEWVGDRTASFKIVKSMI